MDLDTMMNSYTIGSIMLGTLGGSLVGYMHSDREATVAQDLAKGLYAGFLTLAAAQGVEDSLVYGVLMYAPTVMAVDVGSRIGGKMESWIEYVHRNL